MQLDCAVWIPVVTELPCWKHVIEHCEKTPGMQENETHGGEDGHGVDVVWQLVWPEGAPELQKQQSTGVAVAVLPPVTFKHEHVVVRDPARAWETPHVAICAGHGESVHLWVYWTHGHIGTQAGRFVQGACSSLQLAGQPGVPAGSWPLVELKHCLMVVCTPVPHVTLQRPGWDAHENVSQGIVQGVLVVPH